MSCDAKIRPFPGDLELVCEYHDDLDDEHAAVLRDYAYPGSKTIVKWREDDRRNFRGDWAPCERSEGCILPALHPRGCHVE